MQYQLQRLELLQNATKDNIPIIFSAVTDEKTAKLTNDNVTGVLDYLDPIYPINLLLKVDPNIKKNRDII